MILSFLEAYRSTGNQSFLRDGRAGADHLLATLANDKKGTLFLHMDGFQRGKKASINFPDSPFD